MEKFIDGIPDTHEVTLSSGVISLPSCYRFDNISTAADISDSEFEAKKSFSSNESCIQNSMMDNNSMKDLHFDKEFENQPIEKPSYISTYVKNTLQENADMLIDKSILNDLLPYRSTIHSNNQFQKENWPRSFPNLENANSQLDEKCEEKCNDVLKSRLDSEDMSLASKVPGYISPILFSNNSSTPKKNSIIGNRTNSKLPEMQSGASPIKQVKFTSQFGTSHDGKTHERNPIRPPRLVATTESLYNNVDVNKNSQHNLTHLNPDIVFSRLKEIRHHLEADMENLDESTTNLPLSRLLVAKLNSQKQRTKDLEEELALNEASLAKTTRELEIVQKRLMRREEQLKEAGFQLGNLQNEWQTIQQKLVHSRDVYQNENDHIKKVVENLRSEKINLEHSVKSLTDQCKEYSILQVKLQSCETQFLNCAKQYDEVLKENSNINSELKDANEKVNYYEKDYVPQLIHENKLLDEKMVHLHKKLDDLTQIKNSIEKEMQLLQDRHSVLLRKAVDEEELRTEAVKQKELTLTVLDKFKSESSTMRDELHQHYQNQVQSIVLQRTNEIRTQAQSIEEKLHGNFSSQIEKLKETHTKEIEEINKRHAKEWTSFRSKYDHQETKLLQHLQTLQQENETLKNQRQAIILAISSVIPASELNLGVLKELQIDKDKALTNKTTNRKFLPNFKGKNVPTHLGSSEQCHQIDAISPKVKGKENVQSLRNSKPKHLRYEQPLVPLITSTSLSSLSGASSNDTVSEGKTTVRNKRNGQGNGINKYKSSEKIGPSDDDFMNVNGRKFYRKSEILRSMDTLCSGSSKPSERECDDDPLKQVDREMAELVEEINSMSHISSPYYPNESPRHDTSLEQDSAHLTLQKIHTVSDMLNKYVNQ